MRQITVVAWLLLAGTILSACGKRVSVVTYEKKRGDSRQNTYKTPTRTKKEDYFDFGDGRSGTSTTRRATGSSAKVIETARSYLGTPYRYGGTERSGIDCSGLLCNSFQAVGFKLPRSSNEQAEAGREVSLNEIAPGDMVFFSDRKGGNRVTHAGLVTAVKSKENITFIHSSTSRGVIEDNLLSDYYRGIFIKAVRPF